VIGYQNTVLAANKEAEDAIVAFLREQQRAKSLQQAVQEVTRALEIGLHLYEQGVIDYQRVLDSVRALVLQQDALAESQGKVATNLVAVYKAIGGGWRMRYAPNMPEAETGTPFEEEPAPADDSGTPAEPLPVPADAPMPPVLPSTPE